jgi:type III pantothenate kinase
MNLILDVGNTRTKMGVFDGGQLVYTEVVGNISFEKINELATNHEATNIIYSSVAHALNDEEQRILGLKYGFVELNATIPLPIKNLYRTPETLGKDRLAAVVGAWTNYPGHACLVIDAGTCITYDILRKEGAYLGGNIAPGLKMRLQAMHRFTARLPEVAPAKELNEWIGDSTESALQNGAQVGILMEATAFINYCEQRFGQLEVIFTGGDADFFANHLKRKIFVNQNLVLEGLNKILEYNA